MRQIVKTLRARIVLPVGGSPIEDGVLRIENGRISHVGRSDDFAGQEVEDLGDVILMPGLINAHCHLDYTAMKERIPSEGTFPEWIARINELKRSFSEEDYLDSIQSGFAELRKWGTTGVFNIESFPDLLQRLPVPRLRTWWFYELLDIRGSVSVDDIVTMGRDFFAKHPDWKGGFGFSPHAPYTASAKLYEETARRAKQEQIPWTTHLSETEDEFAMFRNGSGPLYDFLSSFGRPMDDTGIRTPVAHLSSFGGIPEKGILAHMNLLSDADFDLLENQATQITIVHCPKCHAYFNRPPFDASRLLQHGLSLCLGTDSLASNNSLNLFEEMQEFRQTHPAIPASEIIAMVTRHPAKAIGLERKLGELVPGAYADLIAVPFDGPAGDASDAVLHNQSPIEWMMVEGENVPYKI